MIWDIIQQSTFNSYFSSPDTLTVQTLLLDQNIITEFKNLNPQLIDYVQAHKDEFISRLIFYVVSLPSIDDSEDRIKKLPYVSSEVLSIDNQIIYNVMLETGGKDYFSKLIKIFETNACENEILLGYFVKIVQSLHKSHNKNASKQIYNFRQIFYSHLHQESVGTVIKLFLILLQTQQGFMLSQRKQVLSKVIDEFLTESQVIKNVCKNILVEVISKFQTFSSGDELFNFIMASEKLQNIFTLQQSQSIDQFLVGYLSKALQKICSTGNTQVSLIEISQSHKQKIKNYIKAKKNILVKHKQDSSFLNQSRKKVYHLDKYISTYLVLIKLALENGIIELFQDQDVHALFQLLLLHPSNDIIKVKIFDIFALIYTKKDEQSKALFEKYFYHKAVELYQSDKSMFGFFLFQLCKKISNKTSKQLSISPQLIQKWNEILKYFELNEKYEKETQKVVDMYSNRTKVVKLVVDEEDAAPNLEKQNLFQNSTNQNQKYTQKELNKSEEIAMNSIKQKPQLQKKQNKSSNSFDALFGPKTFKTTHTQPKIQNDIKNDPFASFQFFGSNTQKKINKIQQKKTATKTDFSDFSSFF